MAVVDHRYVYPGFDNVAARVPALAGLLRTVCYGAERSAMFRRFGLSHLLVLRRGDTPMLQGARP
jgi:hypothetical protein